MTDKGLSLWDKENNDRYNVLSALYVLFITLIFEHTLAHHDLLLTKVYR